MIQIGHDEALISPDGKYRYLLTRRLIHGMGQDKRVCFVMLNPSTADATTDDPTIRRCIGFAKRWEFDILEVVNMFAYRSTNPKHLSSVENPYGPQNHEICRAAFIRADRIVAAWGAAQFSRYYAPQFMEQLRLYEHKLFCVGTTVDGRPRHPLYVPYDLPLQPYKIPL